VKLNFVLVDYENVQPRNIELLQGGSYKIKVFLGAHQAKIPLETARTLQTFGRDAEYIQIDGNGKNALDFHIAYHLGRLASENPGASFYMISKDAGFDPLIQHLKVQKVACQRFNSIADIFPDKEAKPVSILEKVDAVIDNLARRKTGKPRTEKTLRSTINALFVKQLSDEELDKLIEQLTKRKAIRIVEGKVQYELPS
jgi:PIN domain